MISNTDFPDGKISINILFYFEELQHKRKLGFGY